jgi:hypothetical protein
MLTPGWHLSENDLIYDGDVGADESVNVKRSRATSEYVDASAALLKTMDLLQAAERKANQDAFPRTFTTIGHRNPSLESQEFMPSGHQGSPEGRHLVTEGTHAGTTKDTGCVVEDECAVKAREDGLMVDGFSVVSAHIAIKVGRQRADRVMGTNHNNPDSYPL